jgi:TonB-dependent starch-binding outer membrane protein SusC
MKKIQILLFLILLFSSYLQGQNITGLVTNIIGEPLKGANIVWENHAIGAVTDDKGLFSIPNIDDTARILMISFVGFKTEKIEVRKITHWEVQLIEDASLTEVTVSGKSAATRFTNDVAKVESSVFARFNVQLVVAWRDVFLPIAMSMPIRPTS